MLEFRNQLLTHTLEQPTSLTDRRAVTWQACDALSSAGQKPSIGLVRAWTLEHTGAHRGSAGDVQSDIAAWYEMVFRLRHEKPLPDIPHAIADSMRSLWSSALSAAHDTLNSEREQMAAERAEMERLVNLAQADTAAAVALTTSLKSEIQVVHANIAGRDETIKRMEQALAELSATSAAKDERIAGLTADLATKEAERASSAAQMEGLRRATLLQIDQARGEARGWKAEYERLTTENKSSTSAYLEKISRLDNDLASAQGRLSAVEESLAVARRQSVDLEDQLSAARARELATAAAPTSAKRPASAAGARGRFRPIPRRKL